MSSYDNLSDLLHVNYCQKVMVIFDYPSHPSIKFVQHPKESKFVIPFLTFIGGNTKDELKEIRKSLDCKGTQIREAKRIDFPYEMKVKGLRFQDLKTLAKRLRKCQ